MGSPAGGAPIHTNTACRYCSPNAYLTSTAVAPGVSVDNCIALPPAVFRRATRAVIAPAALKSWVINVAIQIVNRA